MNNLILNYNIQDISPLVIGFKQPTPTNTRGLERVKRSWKNGDGTTVDSKVIRYFLDYGLYRETTKEGISTVHPNFKITNYIKWDDKRNMLLVKTNGGYKLNGEIINYLKLIQ